MANFFVAVACVLACLVCEKEITGRNPQTIPCLICAALIHRTCYPRPEKGRFKNGKWTSLVTLQRLVLIKWTWFMQAFLRRNIFGWKSITNVSSINAVAALFRLLVWTARGRQEDVEQVHSSEFSAIKLLKKYILCYLDNDRGLNQAEKRPRSVDNQECGERQADSASDVAGQCLDNDRDLNQPAKRPRSSSQPERPTFIGSVRAQIQPVK